MRDKDMYLPNWLLAFGVVLLIIAVACVVTRFTVLSYAVLAFVISLPVGIAAILCWKNQWVEMLNDSEFIYSTMFGRQHRYRFSDIKGLKKSNDSMTLFLENGKVHIEACAICSERFIERVNRALNAE